MNFIVPYSPGGGYDTYARMVAPYLEKYTGSTVVVKNVPGGGSLIGDLEIYRAQPDGLTMGIVQLSSLVARVLLGENLGFELSKYTWLSRVATEARVVTVGAKSPYRSVEDLLKANKPIKFSAAGVGSSDFNHEVLFIEALGLKATVATAYEGSSEQDLAVARGDVDGTLGGYPSKLKLIQSGDMIPVAQFGGAKDKDLPNVPLASELPNLSADGKAFLAFVNNQTVFDRVLVAPPGMSAGRAKYLSEAVFKALSDPELLEKAQKMNRPVAPLSGEEVAKGVKEALQMPDDLKAKVKQALAKYK